MDWMLSGIAPTGKPVKYALVMIVQFREGKLANERIYWDQASVLVHIGLVDPAHLPIARSETAQKVLNPALPSNALIYGLNGIKLVPTLVIDYKEPEANSKRSRWPLICCYFPIDAPPFAELCGS